jgi:hypothetical protein
MKIQLPDKYAFCGYKDGCLIQFQLPESWAGTQIKQLRTAWGVTPRMGPIVYGTLTGLGL